MNRFCQECGATVQSSDSVCTECGKRIEEPAQVSTVNKERKPMTKTKKIFVTSAVCLLTVLAGLFMYGSSYTSADSTLQRFHKAVFDKDKEALKKIMEYEGGTKLSNGELEAVIAYGEKEPTKFVKSIGPWGHVSESFLFSLKQSGKAFGVFDGHKVIIPNQYLVVPSFYEEISYTLNDEKVDVVFENGEAIIGPVAPGIYEFKAVYEGEYATSTQKKEIELLERSSDMVYENIEFDISDVTFVLEDSHVVDPGKTYALIGDKKIDFDEDGYIRDAGPFVLDGNTKVKIVSEFPWGSFESEELEIVEDYMNLDVSGLNEEVEKDIVDTILTYAEQSVAAFAAVDTKNMNSATDFWKDIMQAYSEAYLREKGNYTGLFEELQADVESAYVSKSNDEYKVFLPVSFLIQSSFDEYGESKELSAVLQACSIEVTYIKDEWKVNSCMVDWYESESDSEEAGGITIAGSKKLHKPVVTQENSVEEKSESTE